MQISRHGISLCTFFLDPGSVNYSCRPASTAAEPNTAYPDRPSPPPERCSVDSPCRAVCSRLGSWSGDRQRAMAAILTGPRLWTGPSAALSVTRPAGGPVASVRLFTAPARSGRGRGRGQRRSAPSSRALLSMEPGAAHRSGGGDGLQRGAAAPPPIV